VKTCSAPVNDECAIRNGLELAFSVRGSLSKRAAGASACAAWLKSLSAHLPLNRTVSGRSVQQAAESADVSAPMRRRESALCGRLDFNRLQLDSQRDAGGCCDRCLARIARRVPLFPRIAGSRIGPVLLQSPEWKIPTSLGPRHSPIEDQRVRRRFPFLN
jgi:hypothetical protein